MAENQKPIKTTGRGGKRQGAGRKPGSLSRRTQAMNEAIADRLEQVGGKMDPVEAMMEIAEWAVREWRENKDVQLATAAVEWLAKAAPYIRPRLAAVEARVNVNVTVFERIQRANQRLATAA